MLKEKKGGSLSKQQNLTGPPDHNKNYETRVGLQRQKIHGHHMDERTGFNTDNNYNVGKKLFFA